MASVISNYLFLILLLYLESATDNYFSKKSKSDNGKHKEIKWAVFVCVLSSLNNAVFLLDPYPKIKELNEYSIW